MPFHPSITRSRYFDGRISVESLDLGIPAHYGDPVRHLNPAVVEVAERGLFMVWRVEMTSGLSQLACGWLRRNELTWTVDGAKWLDCSPPEHSADDWHNWDNPEDPRLIECGGLYYLLFARVRNGAVGWSVVQCMSEIDPDQGALVGMEWAPKIGRNTSHVEKNWTPFAEGSKLRIHYGPEVGGIYDGESGLELQPRHGKAQWQMPFGTFSGRSQAHEVRPGRWLAIGGGSTKHPSRCKRYYLTAWSFEAPTYECREISRLPLLWASDDDFHLDCPRDKNYNPCCIFTGGAVRRQGGQWLIPVGVHDSWLAMFAIPEQDFQLVPKETVTDGRMLWRMGDDIPHGLVAAMVVGTRPMFEDGAVYHPGESFLTTPSRLHGLGADVVEWSPEKEREVRTRMEEDAAE